MWQLKALTRLAQGILAGVFGVSAAMAQTLALPPLDQITGAQFSAVGRLGTEGFVGTQGCSATLIAPDLVLTAAHCASPNGRSGKVFAAGWTAQGALSQRGTKHETRHPDYAPGGSHTPASDVALIVLDSPMNDVIPIPLGDVAPSELHGSRRAMIGYHIGSPDVLSGDLACPVGRFSQGLLHVGCPVLNGNSGSPLLGQDDNGNWRVVGVISSRLGAGAIAVAVPDWLREKVAAHLAP